MPAFGGVLSDAEIREVVDHVRTLWPPDSATVLEPVALPELPVSSPELVREGRSLYLLMECWRCHGIRGGGKGPAAAALTDELGRPMRTTDLRHDPFKGGRDPQAIARTLLTGLNGAPMPAYGDALGFGREDVQDRSALEAFLSDADRDAVAAFVAAAPTKQAVGSMDADGRQALRDRRLAALAHYLVSLDRRHGFWSRLFRQQPEQEGRRR